MKAGAAAVTFLQPESARLLPDRHPSEATLGDMRIVGARFPDRRAFKARGELRHRHGLAERDIGVRRLGTTDFAVLPTDLVLAGRFETEQAADAIRVIEQLGGEVLVDRDEVQTEFPTAANATDGPLAHR
jgi:hypothetical protein